MAEVQDGHHYRLMHVAQPNSEQCSLCINPGFFNFTEVIRITEKFIGRRGISIAEIHYVNSG